jgi:hypothetical protein
VHEANRADLLNMVEEQIAIPYSQYLWSVCKQNIVDRRQRVRFLLAYTPVHTTPLFSTSGHSGQRRKVGAL